MAGALTWLSGKIGYVKVVINDAQYWFPFTDWSFPMHAEFLKRNVFRLDALQGYQDGVSGFKNVRVTFKGPWSESACPLGVGLFYEVLFGLTADGPLEYQATIHVTDLTASDTSEDGPMLDVTGDSIGVFDISTYGTDGGLAV